MSFTPQIIQLADGLKCVLLEDYKKLEQERDEAIQQRHETNESSKYAVDYAIRERDEAKELAERMFRERAEALKEIHNQFVEYDKLFDEAEKIRGERDEAREELHDIRLNLGADAEGYTLLHAVCVIQNQRDEARAAIPDGEWVAYEDHKKVHDAASRLLVAINKQLPIGSFSLITHEYHALKDAIYGKGGAK